MKQIGVTHSRDGIVTVTNGTLVVAQLPDSTDLNSTLRNLNLDPRQVVTIQHANGVERKHTIHELGVNHAV